MCNFQQTDKLIVLLSNHPSVENLGHIISAGVKSTADLEKLRAITDAAKSTGTNASQCAHFGYGHNHGKFLPQLASSYTSTSIATAYFNKVNAGNRQNSNK